VVGCWTVGFRPFALSLHLSLSHLSHLSLSCFAPELCLSRSSLVCLSLSLLTSLTSLLAKPTTHTHAQIPNFIDHYLPLLSKHVTISSILLLTRNLPRGERDDAVEQTSFSHSRISMEQRPHPQSWTEKKEQIELNSTTTQTSPSTDPLPPRPSNPSTPSPPHSHPSQLPSQPSSAPPRSLLPHPKHQQRRERSLKRGRRGW